MDWNDPVTALKGVGEKRAALFNRLGIYTIGDLLLGFPIGYEQYGDIKLLRETDDQQISSVYVRIENRKGPVRVKGKTIVTATGVDLSGQKLTITWFNMPYMSSRMIPGKAFVFRGKVKHERGYSLAVPEVYEKERYDELKGRLLPEYHYTAGIGRNTYMNCVKTALETLPKEAFLNQTVCGMELLPASVRMDYREALNFLHFPESSKKLKKARDRLIFEELFTFILTMTEGAGQEETKIKIPRGSYEELVKKGLPFTLTKAQERVLCEMYRDLSETKAMHRLLQGDVGSGKTVIAELLLLSCAEAGYQGAFMAPTQVLARQHFEAFSKLIEENALPVKIACVTGEMTLAQKIKVRQEIQAHEVDIVIGTHALFYEKTVFDRLGLVITDEQHRFGTLQREQLKEKGEGVHVLVMSATPIPRTLAMTLYGGCPVSELDEKPEGRLPLKNAVITASDRKKAWDFLKRELDKGHQAFVICPLIEESEVVEGENVLDYTARLKKYLPDKSIGLLHGRMKDEEKNAVMERMRCKELQVLVSTTVIEVGVNIPNATVMIVEDAQRFGLAQLHQLRGRVGRGKEQGYAVFVDTSGRPESSDRLMIMTKSNDGFFVAKEDLKLRGAGELLGILQSGEMGFMLADPVRDEELLKEAAGVVSKLPGEKKAELSRIAAKKLFSL